MLEVYRINVYKVIKTYGKPGEEGWRSEHLQHLKEYIIDGDDEYKKNLVERIIDDFGDGDIMIRIERGPKEERIIQ